jgi:hypothetical protein
MKYITDFLYSIFISKKKKKQIAAENLKNEIINYYNSLSKESIRDDQQEVITFLKNNPISTFPYPYLHNYDANDIVVYSDKSNGLKYVLLDGKRLYFKRGSSSRRIRRNFNTLLVEQDFNSPHRYLTNNFNIGPDDVIVDIGAAEGNFTLSIIEKVKKAYIFETNKRWIKVLETTFAPWKDKVEIINKFVSDIDDKNNISLDKFFGNNPKVNFIKIDAEGEESRIIRGGEKILSDQSDIKVVTCTYHKYDDENILSGMLKNKGFEMEFSKGYMIFYLDKDQRPPYLRRGLIRAWKK